MAVSSARKSKGRLRFHVYWLLPVVILALLALERILNSIPFSEAITDNRAEFEKNQVSAYMEMNKLLLTLATLAIGGMTGFVSHREGAAESRETDYRRIVISWLLCASSLYFGYLAYQQVTWMLFNGFFNPYNPRLWWPTRLQFWTFLSSAVVFADYVHNGVRRGRASG